MATPTRIVLVLVTVTRTFIAQQAIEIPVFCRNDRFRDLINHGGFTTRYLADTMPFQVIEGASASVSPLENRLPAITLAELTPHLRADGFIL